MAIKLVGKWKEFQELLDPANFDQRIAATVGRATQKIASRYVKEIRQAIRSKNYAKNAELTITLKGSSTPLVNNGDLIMAVTDTMLDVKTAFVGVLRTSGSYNIALILHEGTEIKVTDKMRKFFFLKWVTDPKSGFLPLKPSTTKIVIPPRRFIADIFDRADLRKYAAEQWAAGVQSMLTVK